MPLLAKLTCAWMLGIIISDFHYQKIAICLGVLISLFFCVKKKYKNILTQICVNEIDLKKNDTKLCQIYNFKKK